MKKNGLMLLLIRYQFHFIIVAYSLYISMWYYSEWRKSPLTLWGMKWCLHHSVYLLTASLNIKTFSICRVVFLYSAQHPPMGQGLLIHKVSRSHTTLHTRYDPSGRVISPTQRPLPDNTQHSLEADIHTPGGTDPSIPESKRLQIHALDWIHKQTTAFFSRTWCFQLSAEPHSKSQSWRRGFEKRNRTEFLANLASLHQYITEVT